MDNSGHMESLISLPLEELRKVCEEAQRLYESSDDLDALQRYRYVQQLYGLRKALHALQRSASSHSSEELFSGDQPYAWLRDWCTSDVHLNYVVSILARKDTQYHVAEMDECTRLCIRATGLPEWNVYCASYDEARKRAETCFMLRDIITTQNPITTRSYNKRKRLGLTLGPS